MSLVLAASVIPYLGPLGIRVVRFRWTPPLPIISKQILVIESPVHLPARTTSFGLKEHW